MGSPIRKQSEHIAIELPPASTCLFTSCPQRQSKVILFDPAILDTPNYPLEHSDHKGIDHTHYTYTSHENQGPTPCHHCRISYDRLCYENNYKEELTFLSTNRSRYKRLSILNTLQGQPFSHLKSRHLDQPLLSWLSIRCIQRA